MFQQKPSDAPPKEEEEEEEAPAFWWTTLVAATVRVMSDLAAVALVVTVACGAKAALDRING